MSKIDIVIPWVDGADPLWLKEKNKYYEMLNGSYNPGANTHVRYQQWDNMQYWFRAVEKTMPWVNKIFFVTWGHVPDFLKTDHPKLRIVKHSDFIPAKYLPTFNVNVIELNLHRIKGLSENFIYFNDDLFPLKPIKETYYFKNNKICDEVIESIIVAKPPGMNMSGMNMWGQILKLNNMEIINKHFNKKKVISKNFFKWYSPLYGKYLLRNIFMSYWYDFSSIRNRHMATALKKSTFKEIWSKEPELLDEVSQNKFRSDNDLNQYLFRNWQLCKGDFYPRITQGKSYHVYINNYKSIADDIINKKYLMVCLNEYCNQEEFPIIKATINKAFQKIFPEKSSFEK